MKMIIQIPCLNESMQLKATLGDLPRTLEGVHEVEWLIVDDGSHDDTIQVARRYGVDHIVRLTNNKGLAIAFSAGLDACLKLGADIIVNADADHAFPGSEVGSLVAPILSGKADMVVGDREIATHEHFSPVKRRLEQLGSGVVRKASGTQVADATSGFRAYTREAALQLQVVSKFTYTLETIIQAGKNLVAIEQVPVRPNPPIRESRLFASMWTYIRRNAVAILRIYSLYEPLRVFLSIAFVLGLVAAAIWIRFGYFYLTGSGASHVPSLILGAVLLLAAIEIAALAIVGDMLAASRLLEQRTLERVRRLELQLGVEPSGYEGRTRASDETEAVCNQATTEPHDREALGL